MPTDTDYRKDGNRFNLRQFLRQRQLRLRAEMRLEREPIQHRRKNKNENIAVSRTAPSPRQCLFCANIANSKEHAMPLWILRIRKDKRWGPIRRFVEGLPVKITTSAEIKIKAVCRACNNDWMSKLENDSKPLIGCLLQDFSLSLDTSQQTLLARWTVKTAMVFDGVTKERNRFYTRSECENLYLNSKIPDRTTIWIGRYYGSGFSLDGTEVWIGASIPPDDLRVLDHL